MALENMIVMGLRVAQAFLGLFVLVTSIWVAHWYNTETFTVAPSQVNFMIFAPLWSFISLFYLVGVPRFFPRASNPYGSLLFEILNVLFYFAGNIALTIFISRLEFCTGDVCTAAKCATAGGWLSLLTWIGTLGTMIKEVFKLGFRRGARSYPQMSQA